MWRLGVEQWDQWLIVQVIEWRMNRKLGKKRKSLTDTRSNPGTTLFVSFGASVASKSSDTVLAWTLSCGVVACLARGSHWMTVTG